MKFSPKIDLTKFPTIIDQLLLIMWCSHIYRYSALHLHCDLVNPLYSLFLWFLWYITLDFVHLSILWSSNIVYIALYIISVIALCIALRGTHEGNTSSIRLDSLEQSLHQTRDLGDLACLTGTPHIYNNRHHSSHSHQIRYWDFISSNALNI